MQQSNEFYEDEVIEGFYVPSMVKKAWGVQLDVLSEVDAICVRHNIPYFADWGSLLGTIRHAGYVPWDDDLDISMKRSDYERFLKFAEDELPEGFKVMNFKNHPGHLFFVARIVGKPRICFEEDHLKRFHGFPYIAGIDLFVLDNVCKDRKREELKSKVAEFVITAADEIAENRVNSETAKSYREQIRNYTGVEVPGDIEGEELRVFLYDIAERLFALIPDDESDALVQMMPYGMYGKKRYIPKEYFAKAVRLPYLNTTMCVPVCFDAVMKFKFGNYLEIKRNWDGHDYPFFKGQHRSFLAALDFEYPAYKLSAQEIIDGYRQVPEVCGAYSVVIIPFAPKYWNYLAGIYELYKSDKNATVYVVPIPYYYKAWDGVLCDEQFNPELYPDGIITEDYKTIDLDSLHPDKIIIQNPFDEWNTVTSVPERFYSKVLKKYTDELIYIPFFKTYDFGPQQGPDYNNMDYYVAMPGVANADKVILWSEQIKESYISKLVEFADCAANERVLQILDEKIEVCPDMFVEQKEDNCKDIPEYIIKSPDKKTMVYFVSLSTLYSYKEKALKKIGASLDLMKSKSSDLNILWLAQLCDEENLKVLPDKVAREYLKIRDEYTRENFISYKDDFSAMDYNVIAKSCDAYYGEPSAIALKFVYNGKPVMIQNPDIEL